MITKHSSSLRPTPVGPAIVEAHLLLVAELFLFLALVVPDTKQILTCDAKTHTKLTAYIYIKQMQIKTTKQAKVAIFYISR